MEYRTFFSHTTGAEGPYPYQKRLGQDIWPEILEVPTGLGKTAGVIVAWMYKRLRNDPDTPRRLVYCLPMRVLVEQTANAANGWLLNLIQAGICNPNSFEITMLMGGETHNDWDQMPERNQLLIGTQDMLLSRALNRGYGMSRFRWPIQFGLLHNDALWVFDEVQLMGNGLATSTQLQAFRERLGCMQPSRSLWMSATIADSWLASIDFASRVQLLRRFTIDDVDRNEPVVALRIGARKRLEKADVTAGNAKKCAKYILARHIEGSRTLAMVNTVARARAIYSELAKLKTRAQLVLLHSRFRSEDKLRNLDALLQEPGKEGSICVTTQVIEAGVDVSSRTLFTDLAPWSSLVQRFGRCNRDGRSNDAQIFWFDLDINKKGAALPYDTPALERARDILQGLEDASPASLPPFNEPMEFLNVLRRKDIVELFDTTPDLAGADIDISRFIRESDEHDVQVFWRQVSGNRPNIDEHAPRREELCSVPVNDLRKMDGLRFWRWDHLDKEWSTPETLVPGMVLLLDAARGGYAADVGWTGDPNDIPELFLPELAVLDADDRDLTSERTWETLEQHADKVVSSLAELMNHGLVPPGPHQESLQRAARWHDAGKAHIVNQAAFLGEPPQTTSKKVWGKTAKRGLCYSSKGFRHELASALAMLEHGLDDLAVYLAAAHHGKVRLSIRSLPHEQPPPNLETRFARGIWDGDVLPETSLGGGVTLPETVLDLSYMEMGEGPKGPSWLARALALRDAPELGPFRLAYLEALLRIADWRASGKEDHHA